MMDLTPKVIRIENADQVSQTDFEKMVFAPGQPCILGPKFSSHWNSRNDWIMKGKPNFDFLVANYGADIVPVVDCNTKYFNSQKKKQMEFAEFIRYWQQISDSKGNDASEVLYLKDWHFQRLHPSYRAYDVPIYFQSDWLNEYWDQRNDMVDDYRFVYMGPKGSWTPFHADVFRSFSWSANICGRKRWLLYPPGEENNLKDIYGSLPYDVTSEEVHDCLKYPNFGKSCRPVEIIQEEGEILFVPSGWHHQVLNLEDTISINHNWTNAYGIEKMWVHLQTELDLVKKEIQDCKDMDGWEDQCQMIMKANSGIDYKDFLLVLETLRKPRLQVAQTLWQLFNDNSPTGLDISFIETMFVRFRITSIPKSHLVTEIQDCKEGKNENIINLGLCGFFENEDYKELCRSSCQCENSFCEILFQVENQPLLVNNMRILLYDLKQLNSVMRSLYRVCKENKINCFDIIDPMQM